MFDLFLGLRQAVEGGAQDEAEIIGSRPTFWSFLGFWDYVMGLGCQPMGLPMLGPILYYINRWLGNVRRGIYVMLGR